MSAIKMSLILIALSVIVSGPSIAADSLVVSPPNPTTMDSVSLNILMKGSICCTQFYNDPTAVTLLNDSTIMLGFTVLQGRCPCPATLDSNLVPTSIVATYKRGPLPAGNYFVYEESQNPMSCGTCAITQASPLIGKFTVSLPTAVVCHQKPVPLENIGRTSGTRRVYNIRGALMSPDRLGTSRQPPGVYFIKPDERSTGKGEYSVRFENKVIPAGLYICRFQAGNYQESGRIVVTR